MPSKPTTRAIDHRVGQGRWREGLRLPRATRYLFRYERGRIAFLGSLGTALALPLAA